MRDMTLSDIERLRLQAGEADVAFEMDEEAFGAFYDRTARGVWAYLSRMTGDRQLADDLVQEVYYRFLRARASHDTESHRRNYLYRIATNLVRDGRRRAHRLRETMGGKPEPASSHPGEARDIENRTDLARAMARLAPRERQMLWLAYAQGASHREIGETIGVRTTSVKLLLFRARRKLAGLLRASGKPPGGAERDQR